jgi:hypothetical protein
LSAKADIATVAFGPVFLKWYVCDKIDTSSTVLPSFSLLASGQYLLRSSRNNFEEYNSQAYCIFNAYRSGNRAGNKRDPFQQSLGGHDAEKLYAHFQRRPLEKTPNPENPKFTTDDQRSHVLYQRSTRAAIHYGIPKRYKCGTIALDSVVTNRRAKLNHK